MAIILEKLQTGTILESRSNMPGRRRFAFGVTLLGGDLFDFGAALLGGGFLKLGFAHLGRLPLDRIRSLGLNHGSPLPDSPSDAFSASRPSIAPAVPLPAAPAPSNSRLPRRRSANDLPDPFFICPDGILPATRLVPFPIAKLLS